MKRFLQPYRTMNWPRCLVAMGGTMLGVAELVLTLLHHPLQTSQPAEMLGSYAYIWDRVHIDNRLVTVGLAMLLAPVVFHVIAGLLAHLPRATERCAHKFCALAFAPALLEFVPLAFKSGQNYDGSCLRVAVILLLSVLVLTWRHPDLDERHLGAALGAIFFSFYIPQGVHALLRPFFFFNLGGNWLTWDTRYIELMRVLFYVLPAAMLILCCSKKVWPHTGKILRITEFMMLLLFFRMLPEIFLIDNVLRPIYHFAKPLFCLVLPLVIWGAVDIILRCRHKFTGKIFSPFPILAILIADKFQHFSFNGLQNLFEYGDRISAYEAVRRGGMTLFKDTSIVYGLWDYLILRFTEFFSGTLTMADTYGENILAMLVLIVSFLIFYRYLPWFVAVLLGLGIGTWQPALTAAILLILFNPTLLKNPAKWCTWWLLILPVYTFFRIPQGGILAVATLPLLGVQSYRIFRTSWRAAIVPALVIILLAGLFLWGPFAENFYGLFHMMVSAGAINAPWFASWWPTFEPTLGLVLSNLVLLLPLIGVATGVAIYLKPTTPELRGIQTWAVLSVVVLYTVLSLNYSYARIDYNYIRQYQTYAALLPLLTLVWWQALRHRPGSAVILLLLLWLPMLYLNFFTAPELIKSPLRYRKFGFYPQPSKNLCNGASYGLPKLGQGYGNAKTAKSLKAQGELRQLLDRVLAPQETFLNLTVHGGLYFGLERPQVTQHNNFYTVIGETSQRLMLKQLQSHQVKVAVWGRETLDDAYPMIRTPLLARYALQCGVPVAVNDEYFVTVPREYLVRAGLPVPSLREQIAIFDRYYPPDVRLLAPNNLIYLPPVWGRGFPKFVQTFSGEMPITEVVSATELEITYRLPCTVDGRELGMLVISAQAPCWAGARWSNEIPGNEQARILFRLEKGPNIVPLDSFPRWLLGRQNRTITLFTQDKPLKINHLTLFQRELPPEVR